MCLSQAAILGQPRVYHSGGMCVETALTLVRRHVFQSGGKSSLEIIQAARVALSLSQATSPARFDFVQAARV